MSSDDQMKVILVAKFAPLNFVDIPGFPNVVPTIDEWRDYLTGFKEKKDDHPTQHLIKFHKCMDQFHIHHEDVLMKMFMYSLEGDARQWYWPLPYSGISSSKRFHIAFNDYCRRFYPAKYLFESCGEEFKLYTQQSESSSSMNVKEFIDEEMEEDFISHESSSYYSIQEEEGCEEFVLLHCHSNYKESSNDEYQNACDSNIVHTFVINPKVPSNFGYNVIVVPNMIEDHTVDDSIKEHKSSSLSFEPYQSALVYDEYNDDSEISTQHMIVLQFQQSIESIIHEEIEPVYNSFYSEDEQIFITSSLEPLSHAPVYDIGKSDLLEGNNKDKYVSFDHMHEETVQQKNYFIKHDMSHIGIDETNLLPSYLHNNLVSLESAKGNYAQETCEKIIECFATLEGYETCDFDRIFQAGQVEHNLADETNFIW
jgi:hypothetical protein